MTDKSVKPGDPGTTQDPNQANLTPDPVDPIYDIKAATKARLNGGTPGTTRDPNQADRT